MSDGWYTMQRGWQDHHLFEGDVYSERDAWCWLVGWACYAEKQVYVSGRLINLKRGQLSYSLRFLGEKWKWDKCRVARFLEKLSLNLMIKTASETGQTLITICNYDHYQRVIKDRKAEGETVARQNRDKEEQGKQFPYGAHLSQNESSIRKQLYDLGVAFLISKGSTEKTSRAFLGMLRKTVPDEKILGVLLKAQEADVIEPMSWISAALNTNREPPGSLKSSRKVV